MPRPLSQQTDEELIVELQHGNEGAFDLLVARYKDPLTTLVTRIVGRTSESDDIVQETFVRVYRRRSTYRPVARFSTWIYTIALNLVRSQLRRRALHRFVRLGRTSAAPEPEFDVPDDSSLPDALADSAMMGERIQDALDALPSKLREAIVMRDVQDLSYEEISDITGAPLGTVKSRISRARALLKESLKDIAGD